MIGKHTLIVSGTDFVKGMSTSSEISDGGFSPETDAINPIAVPGIAYAPAVVVGCDDDNRLSGCIIASSPDMTSISPSNRLLVADNDTYYKYNGTKIIAAAYTGGTASTTAAGFTDIITFQGEAYVSCKERIKRWINTNTISDLGSFTTSSVPHPMIVYENNWYAADGNLLRQATAVNTMPATILTLDANQIIMAIGIDPGTGLMLISTVTVSDTSDTVPTISRLLWYDGNSTKVTKSVIVEDAILGFHTNSGTTFVGYGKNLGYINGSGITFLRRLKNVTNVKEELPYKHHFASIANTMYVLDGLQILAYGEILPGQKKFYYAFKNNDSTAVKSGFIANGGVGKIIIGFSRNIPGNQFVSFDTTSVATTNGMTLYSNEYSFPRPILVRSVVIEYYDAVANGDNNRTIYYQSEDRLSGLQLLRIQGSAFSLKNETGASVYFQENIIGFLSNKMRSIQFRYGNSTVNTGIKRIILYYDISD